MPIDRSPDQGPNENINPVPHLSRISGPSRARDTVYKQIVEGALEGGVLEGLQDPVLLKAVEREMLSGTHGKVLLKSFSLEGLKKYRLFLAAWHLALKNSGVPLNFADTTTFGKKTVWISGVPYHFTTVQTLSPQERKILMQRVSKYVPQRDSKYYEKMGLNLDQCPLCNNLSQTVDAQQDKALDRSNAFGVMETDEGAFVFLVNKFPYLIGDSLVLRLSHNNLLNSATADAKERLPSVSKTMLEVVFAISDKFSLAAQKNHPKDGETVLNHTHFKLAPEENPCFDNMMSMIKKLEEVNPLSDGLSVSRAPNCPFDMIVLSSNNRSLLATAASLVLEEMEKEGEVFTLAYAKGHLFILPRRKELYKDEAINTGSGVNLLAYANSDHLKDILRTTPLMGEFNWSPFLNVLPADTNYRLELTASSYAKFKEASRKVFEKYIPLSYPQDRVRLGYGEMLEDVEPPLPDFVKRVFESCKGVQDLRNDEGHAETVTYFTNELARVLNLPEREREIALLAAVLHDTGYSEIDDISAKFADLTKRQSSGDPLYDQLNQEIRIAHQEGSKRVAENKLKGYEHLEEVVRIVSHHDTRDGGYEPSLAEWCMRDADLIARVSYVSARAAKARQPERYKDLSELLEKLEREIRVGDVYGLHFLESLQIARIELANTALILSEESNTPLPKWFKEEYKKELEFLAGRSDLS
ncbi:MAG: HD domain-containing protein [Candidatus Dadabacteria bacterium]|nr:MAG: HD domain-containing protein [Candidatus Dadabacteria bacterium]